MAELRRSDKPDPSPNFVDQIFKEDPTGTQYRQWQSVDTFLENYGAQLEGTLGSDNLQHGTVQLTDEPVQAKLGQTVGFGSAADGNLSNSNRSTDDVQVGFSVGRQIATGTTQDSDKGSNQGAVDRREGGATSRRKLSEQQIALNKLAQKRYREKKRARQEGMLKAKDTLDDTVTRLDDMRMKNEALEKENAALEAELSQKQSDMEQLKAVGGAGKTGAHAHKAANNDGSDAGSGTDAAPGCRFSGRPVAQKRPHEVAAIERDWFAKITGLREVMNAQNLWTDKPVEGPIPEGAKLGELAGALEAVVTMCCKVAAAEGLDLNNLLARTYETVSDLNSWSDPDRWLSAASDIYLAAQQKRKLMALRVECLNRLKLIYEERQRLSKEVVAAVVPSAAGTGSNSDDNTKLIKVMAQLEENLKNEQRFNVQMLYAVFKYILNPVQAGWLILKAFPEHVDVLAFMAAVQQLYGAEQGMQSCTPTTCSIQ